MPINFTAQDRIVLLAALHTGRQNATRAIDLARTLHYPTTGNQVRLRLLIKECIEYDEDLIGAATSRPAGFYLISNLSELDTYIDSLERRTSRNNERRTALINNWNNNPNLNPKTNRHIRTIQ